MRLALLALTITAAIFTQASAQQQPVRQGGPTVPPTQGHAPRWQGDKLIGDSGPAVGGPHGYGATEMNITNNTGSAPLCLNDAPITNPAGYRQTCLGADVDGAGGSISYSDYAFEAPLPFSLQSQGVLAFNSNIKQIALQNLPATVAGDVSVCVNRTTGQLFKAPTVDMLVLLTDDSGGHLLTDDTGAYLLTATVRAGSCTQE